MVDDMRIQAIEVIQHYMRHSKYFRRKTLAIHRCQINRLFYLDLNTELNNKREELQENTAVTENLRKENLG